jgi:uncharacterized protein (TIRG00374 family)
LRILTIFFLILAFLIFILSLIINFLRWHYIVTCLGISLTRLNAVKLSFQSLFAENTPGRVGEPILKAVYLKKHSKSQISSSLFSTTFHKFIDLWAATIQALFVVIILFFIFKIKLVVLIPSVLVLLWVVIILFIFIYNKRLSISIVKPFFNMFVPHKHKKRVKDNLISFYSNFQDINKKRLFISFIYDLVEVVVTGVCLYFIFLAVNQNVPLIHAILVIPLLTIGVGLPLSVSGLGIRESILVFYFGLLGIKPEVCVAAGILFLLIKIFSIIPGLIISFIERKI